MVGVNVDIDAYKQLEARAAAQLQFQQQVPIDTISIPIAYKDAQGRYLGFNRALRGHGLASAARTTWARPC